MKIQLDNVGKQYNGEWIFKSISLSFSSDDTYWIAGGNGSGKSTLLKVLSGFSIPSVGGVRWTLNGKEVEREEVYKKVSFCSPAMGLYENHTVKEAIEYHFSLKPVLNNLSTNEILAFCYLTESQDKTILQLSSGMLQRLKLTLTLLSNTEILLLDEPCANLDDQAISWYQEKLKALKNERLLIICSNNKQEEHFLCNKTINLEQYKDFN